VAFAAEALVALYLPFLRAPLLLGQASLAGLLISAALRAFFAAESLRALCLRTFNSTLRARQCSCARCGLLLRSKKREKPVSTDDLAVSY
jgi:hypothetical protein